MSKAAILSILASRDNLGQSGQALTSTGDTSTPSFSGLPAGVNQLNAINTGILGSSPLSANSTTGNITIRSDVSLSELDVPGWDRGQHITQWSTLQTYLSGVIQTNSKIPVTGTFVQQDLPALNSGFNWQGCILHPNGNVYLIPNQTTAIGVYNPMSNTYTFYGSFTLTTGGNYYGGCLAADGKIYMSAQNNTIFRVFDPGSNTLSSITNAIGTQKFIGAVAAPNGRIYYLPHEQTMAIVYDPSNNTFATIGSFTEGGTTTSKHYGGTLAPNGRIYLHNAFATVLKIIDTSNNSVQTINDTGGYYTCLGPNGKIYLLPFANVTTTQTAYTNSLVRVLDPNNNSISVIGTIPAANWGDSGYSGGCLAPNGKIYMVPQNHSFFVIVDPSNDTVTSFITFAGRTWVGASKYESSVLLPNGNIYVGTDGATQPIILNILSNNNFNMNVCTNPMFNKGI